MSDTALAGGGIGSVEYSRAVLNILEDFALEKDRLQQTQKAVLNILDDASEEKQRLQDMQKAVLNILDDLAQEKKRLEETQQVVVRSEHAARVSLKEKEVLLKEIHHRVKNNLQVISSLLNLQARYLADPAAREIFNETQNRVLSIALVHEKLYQSPNLSHVNFAEYASALVDNLFHTYNANSRGIARTIDVGGAQLPIDVAIPCGLIVNELVTNALKHAFPSGRTGTLQIILKETEPRRFELLVADDGIGLPKDLEPRQTQSLGLDLVFTFAEQLEATVDITRDSGTRFSLRFSGGVG
jgi:two-component sensor histidine kinase